MVSLIRDNKLISRLNSLINYDKINARQEIAMLRQIAFKRFYSRPMFILKKIIELRTIHDLKAVFKGFKSLFWLWAKKGVFKAGNH